jgi:hypothetical protein
VAGKGEGDERESVAFIRISEPLGVELIPLLARRGGCGINKSREATEAPQTGAKRERDSAKPK